MYISFDLAVQGIGIYSKEVICELLFERQYNRAVKRTDPDTKLPGFECLLCNY